MQMEHEKGYTLKNTLNLSHKTETCSGFIQTSKIIIFYSYWLIESYFCLRRSAANENLFILFF